MVREEELGGEGRWGGVGTGKTAKKKTSAVFPQ